MKKSAAIITALVIAFTSIVPFSIYAQTPDAIVSKMYDTYSKAISLWGKENFYNYCGAFVGHQLWALGINNKYVALNGNQTYNHYASIDTTGGGYSARKFPASQYSMSAMLNYLNSDNSSGAVFPTLIGFNKGSASDAGQTYGHALLVYEVSGGFVYYTDVILPKWQDNVFKVSIGEFVTTYSDKADTPKHEFVYDGAVQFYSQSPLSANVRVSKQKVSLWEDITFNISAPGSTSCILGIDRGFQRITTINAGNQSSVNLQFGEEGVYTVYVTSCNVYGSIDSQRVTFEVYGAPKNPHLSAKTNPTALGSPIEIEYGASDANIYCIGVTYPDGSYNVSFSQYGNYSIASPQRGVHKIFVTCCNAYGYVDTQTIEVNVY